MASMVMKNLSKTYPGSNQAAVSDFNMEITDGEFIVMVGPSGCGKSTTLRMIAGLEGITQGELYIDGKLMNQVQAKDRDISMVFQNYALYPHMTAYENIAFGLKMRHVAKDKIRSRVERVAESMGISGLLGRKPKALSGGERQRVALGRAMVREPKVFLFDEPLSNLDARLRAQMREDISALHRQLGATFVYVTHDQVEAMSMADRIIVMKDGVTQQIGTPPSLYEVPRNLFVAQFMGSSAINLLDGAIKNVNGHTYVEFGAERLLSVKLMPEQSEAAAAYLGKAVIIGIRPEDILCGSECVTGAVVKLADGEIQSSQMMGAETTLCLLCDGVALNSKVSSKLKTHSGQVVPLYVEPRSIHLFDAVSKQAIIS